MGWNSWCVDSLCNAFGDDPCSDHMVRTTVDAMAINGMRDAGYDYAVLDDCWAAKQRDAAGDLVVDASRFPHGMADLADYVHARGFSFGLYTSYGTKTCKGDRPGSFGHYAADAKLLAGWGVDFIKMDHCGSPGKNYTDRQLYGEMAAALNATGRSILFSLCQWGESEVWTWGSEVAQMYRVAMDHLPLWSLPASVGKAKGVGMGQGVKEVIEWMAALVPSKYTRQYGWMDPDFLMTLKWPTMDFVDSRTEFSFWSLWSSPLIVTTDVRHLSAGKAKILLNREVIAINQDVSYTAGDRLRNASDGGQVWARPLANGDKAVVLYNDGRSGGAVDISVEWAELSWAATASVSVRDLWKQAVVQSNASSGFRALQVEPKDVVFLRLSKAAAGTAERRAA